MRKLFLSRMGLTTCISCLAAPIRMLHGAGRCCQQLYVGAHSDSCCGGWLVSSVSNSGRGPYSHPTPGVRDYMNPSHY
ncbi:hypothetical protein EDB81DRAFT_482894 [Dactylonectria macrodidyma]|uniref:Secreted protein n=1 Tax=Dactylonectria macrodidyma TaxID=307937 RepID=A0A9P9CXF7_9HYPO|nr:hypothetical protein EDB81DRAFT_482894 [Dactylonectria macrodidyma]